MRLLYTLFALFCLQVVESKICYDYCDPGIAQSMKSVDIIGCRRRSSYAAGRADFNCRGTEGPPCTVRRGDVVVFNATIHPTFAVRQMTQDVVWQNGFIDLPWPGLDKEGCKFLEGNCKLNNANRDLNFAYNINILSAYPPGHFPLKWTFTSKDESGNKVTLGCMKINVRIV